VRVLRINLLLAVALGVLAVASPAHASPISAHAMVYTCCTPDPLRERIFDEAEAVGADFIRVDVQMSAIFQRPNGKQRNRPDWTHLDQVLELAREHHLHVLGLLLAPPAYISTCPDRGGDAGRCPAADTGEFGRLAGEIAEHARDTIRHWEVLNEPDAEWAFAGTPDEYAAMLSAAHDGIKARVPNARVVLGGISRPKDTAWLERVFASPEADAIHKFDIAGVHLRGPVDPVVHRYRAFHAWLAARGFGGPLWVTETGYPADPAHQVDPRFSGGDAAQAGYLTQLLVELGEAGAEQVFVTLRDNDELDGQYVTEGLADIAATAGGATMRRDSFAAVRRLATNWDELMAWRREQRGSERLVGLYEAVAAVVAGRRAALLWHSAYSRLQRTLAALGSGR
jgi:hypothetical protein